jgi:hypothetical protein
MDGKSFPVRGFYSYSLEILFISFYLIGVQTNKVVCLSLNGGTVCFSSWDEMRLVFTEGLSSLGQAALLNQSVYEIFWIRMASFTYNVIICIGTLMIVASIVSLVRKFIKNI